VIESVSVKRMLLLPFQGWGFLGCYPGLAPWAGLFRCFAAFARASRLKSSHDEVDRGACEHLCSRRWILRDDD